MANILFIPPTNNIAILYHRISMKQYRIDVGHGSIILGQCMLSVAVPILSADCGNDTAPHASIVSDLASEPYCDASPSVEASHST